MSPILRCLDGNTKECKFTMFIGPNIPTGSCFFPYGSGCFFWLGRCYCCILIITIRSTRKQSKNIGLAAVYRPLIDPAQSKEEELTTEKLAQGKTTYWCDIGFCTRVRPHIDLDKKRSCPKMQYIPKSAGYIITRFLLNCELQFVWHFQCFSTSDSASAPLGENSLSHGATSGNDPPGMLGFRLSICLSQIWCKIAPAKSSWNREHKRMFECIQLQYLLCIPVVPHKAAAEVSE